MKVTDRRGRLRHRSSACPSPRRRAPGRLRGRRSTAARRGEGADSACGSRRQGLATWLDCHHVAAIGDGTGGDGVGAALLDEDARGVEDPLGGVTAAGPGGLPAAATGLGRSVPAPGGSAGSGLLTTSTRRIITQFMLNFVTEASGAEQRAAGAGSREEHAMREGLRGTGRRKPALADRPLQGRRYRYLHQRVPQLRGGLFPAMRRQCQRASCAIWSRTAVTASISAGSCPGATSTP